MAERVKRILHFSVSYFYKLFLTVCIIALDDSWKGGLIQHIYYKVAQGDHIVSPAGRSEIELAHACEHDISPECFNFFLFGVLMRLLISEARGKAKVN